MKDISIVNIPADWELKTIGEAFEICNNLRLPISEEQRKKMKGPFPYYGPTKIQDYINEYRLDGKYSLIGEDGDHFLKWKDLPMTLLVDGKFNVNNHAHIIKGKENLTEWFFYYFNNKNLKQYLTRQGAGRYKLTKDSLSKILCPIPPISEQISIVRVLCTWDNAINKILALISQKELRKKWLMKKLLLGSSRNKREKNYWKELHASDFLSLRNEFHIDDGTIPLYSLTIEDGITEKTDRYERGFLVKDKTEKKYKIVYPNDIVFNPSNLRWGAISMNKHQFKVLISPIYEVLHVKEGFDTDFINYMVSSPSQIAYYASIVEGTLVERMAVKVESFLSVKYLLPDIEEQRAISKALMSIDKELFFLKTKHTKLKEQKRGLMQMLLTGKMRIKQK